MTQEQPAHSVDSSLSANKGAQSVIQQQTSNEFGRGRSDLREVSETLHNGDLVSQLNGSAGPMADGADSDDSEDAREEHPVPQQELYSYNHFLHVLCKDAGRGLKGVIPACKLHHLPPARLVDWNAAQCPSVCRDIGCARYLQRLRMQHVSTFLR